MKELIEIETLYVMIIDDTLYEQVTYIQDIIIPTREAFENKPFHILEHDRVHYNNIMSSTNS